MSEFRLSLPDDALEVLAQRVAEIIRVTPEPEARWLYGAKAAADYLGWPVKRVHNKIRELPRHENGGRLMFNTRELDGYVRGDP